MFQFCADEQLPVWSLTVTRVEVSRSASMHSVSRGLESRTDEVATRQLSIRIVEKRARCFSGSSQDAQPVVVAAGVEFIL